MTLPLLVLALAVPAPVRAAEPSAAGLTEADALYFHRDQKGNLEKSQAVLDGLLKAKPDDAEALWRKARGLVRQGEDAKEKADKLRLFKEAEADALKAAPLLPKSAEPHFWAGVAMGRRGETQGILHSLFLISPIRTQMHDALLADPRHGGAHRVLGEILWQVPGFAGGDKREATTEFEEAVRLSPNYTANYPVLAKAYLHFGRKDDAAEVLRRALNITVPDDPAAHAESLAKLRALWDKPPY
ncbi:MAG: tetratricopeptide repeat protein [Elusimicrobia bacterium]|nr:tetratricopeptide repeat protein [Elusimicrobiota bacterium]